MISLNRRLLLASGVTLIVFLGLTGMVLDRAFRASAQEAVRDRLQAHVYALLAAADRDAAGTLRVPADLPEARFSTAGAGLYARVLDGRGQVVWHSPSTLGVQPAFAPPGEPGELVFERLQAQGEHYFGAGLVVVWESPGEGAARYAFQVSEDLSAYQRQVDGFRRSLWGWFAGVALVLLGVLAGLLRWGLAPLRQVARDLDQVRSGREQRLRGDYPRELLGLTESINTFVAYERARQERYRNTLSDLAHSLKTPLAVLRSSSEPGSAPDTDLAPLVREQVARMAQIVDYQLQRPVAATPATLAEPVSLRRLAERVCASLDKVYRDRALDCQLDIEPTLGVQIAEGDLLELLGNLMDNACKWARSRYRVQAVALAGAGGIEIAVEDDGPGIADAQRQGVLQRGVRADEAVAGHGIGLAVVRDIVGAYGGSLHIDRSEELGGAALKIVLPGAPKPPR